MSQIDDYDSYNDYEDHKDRLLERQIESDPYDAHRPRLNENGEPTFG